MLTKYYLRYSSGTKNLIDKTFDLKKKVKIKIDEYFS